MSVKGLRKYGRGRMCDRILKLAHSLLALKGSVVACMLLHNFLIGAYQVTHANIPKWILGSCRLRTCRRLQAEIIAKKCEDGVT